MEQGQNGADSVVLEEEIDPNYVPSEAEVLEYAKWLGMDLEKDQDLIWISKVTKTMESITGIFTCLNNAHILNTSSIDNYCIDTIPKTCIFDLSLFFSRLCFVGGSDGTTSQELEAMQDKRY